VGSIAKCLKLLARLESATSNKIIDTLADWNTTLKHLNRPDRKVHHGPKP
jgi:hypothetical protein